jgi:glycopeptide antibiotics resistance protein
MAIKRLYQLNDFRIAVVLTIVIAYLSLGKPVDIGMDLSFENIDKVKHFMAYFVLTFSWMMVLNNRKLLAKNKRTLLLFLFLYGLLLEVLQMTMTTYRQGDVLDLIANLSGILFCYLIFQKIHQKMSFNL